MRPAIEVNGVSKRYRISHGSTGYRTLRETLTDLAMAPLRRLKHGSNQSSVEDFWALKDISLKIQPGEVVGLIGRNGAGKSTLLKILSRITKPTVGQITLNGRVGSLLEVGTGFHPELSGQENIYLNGAILGMSRREINSKFDQIVEFAEISRFLDTPVKRYSSGMYVRLAFAVAAHLEPEILLVDEVLAVGDASFQRKCLGKMDEVARQGRTVLFVSHNMGAIETLTQRAYVFESGRIAFEGSTADAVQSYIKLNAQYAELQIDALPRSGNGRLRLKRVYAVDEKDEPTNVVSSGGPMSIVMEYDALGLNGEEQGCQNASFGISLHDATGQTLAIHYTDYQGDPFTSLPATGAVVFRMNELPFKAGRYYIGARVVVNGMEADWPRGHVGYFDVETGDFYGTGRSFHSGIATYLLRGEWLVRESVLAGETDAAGFSPSENAK